MENLELEKDRASFLFYFGSFLVFTPNRTAGSGNGTSFLRALGNVEQGSCDKAQIQVRAAVQNPRHPFTPPVVQWLDQLVSSEPAGCCSGCRDESLGSGREIY